MSTAAYSWGYWHNPFPPRSYHASVKRDILTPMEDFKIKRGTYNLTGQATDVWLVIDQKTIQEDAETIAGLIFRGDSGNALVAAMITAGAVKQDD